MLEWITGKIIKWPWKSSITPLVAMTMIIHGTLIFIMPQHFITPSNAVLHELMSIYVWGAMLLVVGLATLIFTYKKDRVFFEFLISGLIFFEAITIFLSIVQGYPVSPAVFLRLIVFAFIIWVSILRRVLPSQEFSK